MPAPPTIRILANWQAYVSGEPWQWANEFPLYTDASFTGRSVVIGPYTVLNTLAQAGMSANEIKPQLILTVENHWNRPIDRAMGKSNLETYHGGSLADEFAALLSLTLGIRVQAGPAIREFSPESGSRGSARLWHGFGQPTLYTAFERSVLPFAGGGRGIEDLTPLKSTSEHAFIDGRIVDSIRSNVPASTLGRGI